MDKRTDNERMIDRFVSNSFRPNIESEFVHIDSSYDRRKHPKKMTFKIDGYVYDDTGKRLRKWYFDYTSMRINGADCGLLNERPLWMSPTTVVDAVLLKRRVKLYSAQFKLVSTKFWNWLNEMYEKCIVPIEIPDHDKDLREYKVEQCRISKNDHHIDTMGWINPESSDATSLLETGLSYAWSTIDIREFKEGTKTDVEATKAIRTIESHTYSLIKKKNRYNMLFNDVMESKIIKDSMKKYNVGELRKCSHRGSYDCDKPHKIYKLTCDGTTYMYFVWYNLMHSSIDIVQMYDSPSKDIESIAVTLDISSP